MSICLCMIVKNESHVIESTLAHLCERIPFAYWVISDTGSTDHTRELIRSFFQARQIPGELVEHAWKDFAYNRTKALECAFMKTDYLMVFDADDAIVGTIQLPRLTADRYLARFGTTESYTRPLILTNRKKWTYKGVLHEYLDAPDVRTTALLQGSYYIHSGRTGARNRNPNKYADDANVLERAFQEESDESLKDRYAFYCAQSHLDAKHLDASIVWYTTCLRRNGWKQERYCACLQLGNLYAYKGQLELAVKYWCHASHYDPERIEGYVKAATLAYKKKDHGLVNRLYHACKGYKLPWNKLFLQPQLYAYEIEFFNSTSAHEAKDPTSGYECCKTILLHHKNHDRVKHALRTLRLYPKELKQDHEFVAFLRSNLPRDVLRLLT